MNKVAVLGVGWGKMDKSKTDKVAVLEVKWLGHIHPPEKTAPLSILFRSVLHKTPFVPSWVINKNRLCRKKNWLCNVVKLTPCREPP